MVAREPAITKSISWLVLKKYDVLCISLMNISMDSFVTLSFNNFTFLILSFKADE